MMSSKKAKKAREIAAFLEVLAACCGKEPVMTGRNLFTQSDEEKQDDHEDY